MSCVTKGLLIEVLEARHELSRLGFTIDDENFLDGIAEDRGNGGCWGDWSENIDADRKAALSGFDRNPETFDEFAFLVKALLVSDEQRSSGLPIHWRISW